MGAIVNIWRSLHLNKCTVPANVAFRFSSIDATKRRKRTAVDYLPKEELSHVLLSPPKPKQNFNGYALFTAEFWRIRRKQVNLTGFKEMSKLIADKWKSMSVSEKNEYKTRASMHRMQENEEYKSLMTSVVKVSDVIRAITDLINEAKKEKSKLKMMNATALFYHEEALKQKGLKLSEVSKRWNTLSDDRKNEYKAAAEKINKETKVAIREWVEKYKFLN